MSFPRTYLNMTLLPDDTVLVTGGGTTTNAVGLSDAVLKVELWSPTTQGWTTLASMSAPRLYHSEEGTQSVYPAGSGRQETKPSPGPQPAVGGSDFV
jgi:hypothetical protein